jgi:predicted permease
VTVPTRGIVARLSGVAARVRGVVFRRAADREMDEEIRFHIEMETEKNMRAGMPGHEAHRKALATFGGVERHRETLREARRVPLLEPFWLDVRFGARFLVRDPALALVAALTIALGVGATTTVFSALNTVLIRPLPLLDSNRLVSIQESRSGAVSTGLEGMLIAYGRVQQYRAATASVFESLSAHRLEASFSLRLADATVAVSGALTAGNYFRTLGVQPALGRSYSADDAAEIVISHELWSTHFARDPGVLGQAVGLDGKTVTVVGVAPAGFVGATFVTNHVWVPVGVRSVSLESWDIRMVPVGSLREGVGRAQAAAAVDAAARSIPAEPNTTVRAARVDALSTVAVVGRAEVTGFFALLLGMALLVLLIAAANIAGVMLSRGFARRREMAVRLAIGAGRSRVVRHLLAESLLIFALAGLLGVGLAYLGTAWLAGIPLPPQLPPVLLDLEPDLRVLAFAAVVTGTTGVVFGLVPALKASRPDLVPALKSATAASTAGEGRTRNFFVGAQVSLAVTLLLTGTLFARSLQQGLRADLGFDADGVVAATIDLGAPLDYERERAREFYRALIERVSALPGVQSAALSQYILLSGSRSGGGASRPDAPETGTTNVSVSSVTPRYFETMGIELVAGRGFTDADADGAVPVVVINQTLADRLWPGESPIGRLVQQPWTSQPAEVIGVASEGRYTFVTEEPTPFVFLSYLQVSRPEMAIHVRAPGAEAATLEAVADAVRQLDPNLAIRTPVWIADLVGTGLFPHRFGAQMVGAFGIVGVILAAIGIYGVLSYHVTRRTRELGVRRALGATGARVVRDVTGRGGFIAAVGCLIGMLAGGVLAHVARGFLFGIRPLDPLTFTAVPILLFVISVFASWVPARRASAVAPSEALRMD